MDILHHLGGVVADGGLGNIFTYFAQSNFVGKVIVLILFFSSMLGWTVMISKYVDLSRLRSVNLGLEKKLMGLSLLTTDPGRLPGRRCPYGILVGEAHRSYQKHRRPGQQKRDVSILMGHVESGLQRAVARQTARYESKMVVLGSIVTAAPFMGLLGTVWGVMDAFGGMAGEASASIQNLAPGVSGALLTTVAGLLVAIPSVIGYNMLLSQTKLCMIELENFASSIADGIELELLEEKERSEDAGEYDTRPAIEFPEEDED